MPSTYIETIKPMSPSECNPQGKKTCHVLNLSRFSLLMVYSLTRTCMHTHHDSYIRFRDMMNHDACFIIMPRTASITQ